MHTVKSIKLSTGTLSGTDFYETTIEISAIPGKYKLSIIGLNAPIGSSAGIINRITAALFNHNIKLIESEYIISFTPGHVRKYGTHYDLAIVAGLLYLNNYIDNATIEFIKKTILLGELSLSGDIISFTGIFSLCMAVNSNLSKKMIVPQQSIKLIENLPGATFIPIDNLIDLKKIKEIFEVYSRPISEQPRPNFDIDMSDIYGQEQAKRALEIAAAGNHHCALFGPPGCGKTMLAKTMVTILPRLTNNQLIEVNAIYSSAGLLLADNDLITQPPFRSPHHSLSAVGLIGGGKIPFPGEVTLAHRGILFLDEFLELQNQKIEMLRQILEERTVSIKKNDYSVTYPASFIMIAAFNPCPCGYYGTGVRPCTCTLYQIKNYLKAISGPILDRIDMQISLDAVDASAICRFRSKDKTSPMIAARVEKARLIQHIRYDSDLCNGDVNSRVLEENAQLSNEAYDVAMKMLKSESLSMRSYYKVLRVSRTIADLEESKTIEKKHFVEAVQMRSIDKLLG